MRRRYSKEHDLIIWVYDACIDARALKETARIMMEADDLAAASRAFLDLSAVERVSLDSSEVAAFSKLNRPLLTPSTSIRVAALATNPLAYSIVRMYEDVMSGDKVTFSIFRRRAECAEFLRVPKAVLSAGPGGSAEPADDSRH